MTEPPLPARALLWVANRLAPARYRDWIAAMRGDLDVAQTNGRALSWACGALFAALHFRLDAMRRPTAAPSGVDEPIGAADRLIRVSLLLVAAGVVVLVGSSIVRISAMSAGGRFWPTLLANLSIAPRLLLFSAVLGALATMTAAIVLCANFRRLPPRIRRVLPFERPFVIFWGADRTTMLARVDAGAPEMSISRLWLVNSTACSGFVGFEQGLQALDAAIGRGSDPGFERLLTFGITFAAVLCVANMLYVIAHVRFARSAADR